MNEHTCLDHGCSHRSLTSAERARLYPTHIVLTEAMVMSLFAERETAATFAAMFDLLAEKEVA